MLRAIVVDDEISGHILLERAIKNFDGVEIVRKYMQSKEVLDEIQEVNPDIAFLDIEMPVINGLELADKIHCLNDNINVIFVTAFNQYAIDAFKVNAIDYLLKPVEQDEVQRVLHKVMFNKKQMIEIHKNDSESIQLAKCLGELEVYGIHTMKPIQWITAKVEELFAFLMIYRGKLIEKWRICEILWPDMNPENATMNLHTTVYRLRKTIKKENIPIKIFNRNGGYYIEFNNCYTDIHSFEENYNKWKNMSGNLGRVEEIALLKQIEQLFQGELFSNKCFEWALGYRESINQKYIYLTYKLCQLLHLNDEIDYEINCLDKILLYFPYEEDACMMLIKLYEKRKDKLGLVHFYQKYKLILKKELDCTPSKKVEDKYEKTFRLL